MNESNDTATFILSTTRSKSKAKKFVFLYPMRVVFSSSCFLFVWWVRKKKFNSPLLPYFSFFFLSSKELQLLSKMKRIRWRFFLTLRTHEEVATVQKRTATTRHDNVREIQLNIQHVAQFHTKKSEFKKLQLQLKIRFLRKSNCNQWYQMIFIAVEI